MRRFLTFLIVITAAGAPISAFSQPYELPASTIDGGGSASTTAGDLTLRGTAGQPDAGSLSSSSFRLRGGFWPQVIGIDDAEATPTATAVEPTVSATEAPTPTATPTTSEIPTATATGTFVPTVPATSTSTRTASATTTPDTPPPSPTPTETPGPDALLGDANCDDLINAADVPALIRSIVDGTTAACGLDDIDQNQSVDEADLEQLPKRIFAR